MAATKRETVLDFFNTGYDDYHVDYRENMITESYDFVINTGSSRILTKPNVLKERQRFQDF
jgi:hypothetical protein